MESQNMTQTSFAQATGISTASLSSIFNGRTKPTLNHIEAISASFPSINLMWLLKGVGNMMNPSTESQSADMAADQYLMSGEGNPSGDNPEETTSGHYPSPAPSSSSSSSFPQESSLDFDASQDRAGKRPGTADAPYSYSNRVDNGGISMMKIVDKPQRKVASIQVIYDDNTIEIFVPKK